MTYDKNFMQHCKNKRSLEVEILIITFFLISGNGLCSFKHILPLSHTLFFEPMEESYFTNSSYFYWLLYYSGASWIGLKPSIARYFQATWHLKQVSTFFQRGVRCMALTLLQGLAIIWSFKHLFSFLRANVYSRFLKVFSCDIYHCKHLNLPVNTCTFLRCAFVLLVCPSLFFRL